MKQRIAGLTALAVVTMSAVALADPPAAPAPAPSAPAAPAPTYTAQTATIHGRLAKPQVLIELQRPTAAAEAGAAHEQLRVVIMKKLEPSATRAAR